MRNNKSILVFLCALLALGTASSVIAQEPVFVQGDVTVLTPAKRDLSATETVTTPFKATLEAPREAVSMSWPLAEGTAIDLEPVPPTRTSREYWLEADAAELARGVPVYTVSPGALVRLNPAPGPAATHKAALDPASLTLIDPAGVEHESGRGMELVAGVEALAEATAKGGLPFPPGTSAFRIAGELGAGAFELRAPHLAAGRFVIHVFEPASDVALRLKTPRSTYLHGQSLIVEAALERDGEPVRARRVEGFVASPGGRTFPVDFRRQSDGVFRARLRLDAIEAPAPGLWEAHVRVDGRVSGLPVLRFARLAFDCAVPTARLDGAASLVAADGLAVRLGVEVAAAGRFDARGVIYGTSADGDVVPFGVAQSAAWLESGMGSLVLGFSSEVLAASGLEAPFEIRDLRLVDQGRMGVLHRQARALVIE